MLTQVSVTTRSAPATALAGSRSMATVTPFARAKLTKAGSGSRVSGPVKVKSKPNWPAACRKLAQTLLPSPAQTTFLPAMDPRCSSKVITSAMIWQGWVRLVRPLITGTVACSAISSRVASSKVRIMIRST